jgi:hypothetical protein
MGLSVAPSIFRVATVWLFAEANTRQQAVKAKLLRKDLEIEEQVVVRNLIFPTWVEQFD